MSLNALETKKQINVENPGAYETICVELSITRLAVAAIANTNMIDDAEGGAAAASFNKLNKLSLEEMMQGINRREMLSVFLGDF